ncbi:MAG: hypothetical protein AUI04_08075 [Candidatus Rokubacteria bacterium 13_2_20CM_2_64_8]|nr:MAG: hypothetical protein AUI04_08075 [Candidatus Rokubacteria bacterium 13_2_20CM_2_64_8]
MTSATYIAVSRPTRSSSVKGPIGYPQPSFIAWSMSSSVARPLSYTRMASRRYGTRRRFTMKAVASLVCTGVLPTALTQSVAALAAPSSVRIVRTTSTSFMSGTGLKK